MTFMPGFCSLKATRSAATAMIMDAAGIQPAARHVGAKYQKHSKTTSGAKIRPRGTHGDFCASGGFARAVSAAMTT